MVLPPVRFEKHVTVDCVMITIQVTREVADELGLDRLTAKVFEVIDSLHGCYH